MDETKLAHYQALLCQMQADIAQEDLLGREGQTTVELDQQAVGRLSRMDALQQQAMARATAGRRQQATLRIAAALARIKDGEFGYCMTCGDPITPRRLDLDPTVPTCVTCARG